MRSKLDLAERQRHAGMYALHRDLLRLRREEPVFRAQRRGGMDGAVLAPEAFVLRFFGTHHDDRLLVVNLGRDLHLNPAPEPLLAPPAGQALADPVVQRGSPLRGQWHAAPGGRGPLAPPWPGRGGPAACRWCGARGVISGAA